MRGRWSGRMVATGGDAAFHLAFSVTRIPHGRNCPMSQYWSRKGTRDTINIDPHFSPLNEVED